MENNEETKQASKSLPAAVQLEADADFALALAMQEQEESAIPTLPTIESESDDDEDESEVSYDDEDYEFFFETQELEAESELLEGEDSNADMDFEEDDIDPDDLSYEELMALGEIVGKENIGLSQEEISKCLHPFMCQNLECNTRIDRCVICQVEYEGVEKLVALSCEHPYHFECISKWLQIKKTCPICNTEVSPPKIARTI